jgi:predicted RNase H-like HicB family nuclease
MTKSKLAKHERLRIVDGLQSYPAVFLPLPEGGWDVLFPNFAKLRSYGVKLETAHKAGEEALTAAIFELILMGAEPPRPSDPDRLIPDEDEPQGTRLIMLEPDKAILRKRLGLEKKKKPDAAKALGLFGK